VLIWFAMRAVSTLVACWLAASVSFSASAAQNKPSPPDVFLVTIDTLRADHVRCYGYTQIQTPALDALAKDGIRFAQAFTPSPLTNTSHTTILTGLLPSVHGVTDFAIPLAPTHATWAELLKQDGYQTAGFIGAIILDSKTLAPGIDRGFDYYDNFPEHPKTKSRFGRVERRGMNVVTRAERWLTAHSDGPHFIWIHLYDPHDPYDPPNPYSRIYKTHLYDGEIAYADSALAHFITYLKTERRYAESLVIVVGDHGEGLGEHQEETHGIFLYDSTTHVPLILKLPATMRVPRRSDTGKETVIDAEVRTTDILPTVLDLLNITVPARMDGKSLKPYFTQSETLGRTALGETDYPQRFGWAPLRSVRAQGFKFIEAPRPELYDLRADPKELTNNYRPWDATVQKFRGLLAEAKRNTPPLPSKGAVGQGTLEELKALGYLGQADVGSTTNVPEPSLLPDPKDKIAEQNLLHAAMMASESGNKHGARAALEKVMQLDSKSPVALRQLGELEYKAGEYQNAVNHLKSAREAQPDDAAAALCEGEALEKIGDLPGARDAIEDSLKLAPGMFGARVLLGQIYLQLKDSKAAEDQFEAVLLLEPGSVDAVLGIARAELAEGRFADAVQQLEPYEKAQSKNIEMFELLAEAYMKLGNKIEAEQAKNHVKLLRTRR
jgi:arylsulfatase A-like enzyme/Flp pilus assembly protein TadD